MNKYCLAYVKCRISKICWNSKKIIPQSDASKQKYLLVDLSFGARIVKKAKKITSTFLFFSTKSHRKNKSSNFVVEACLKKLTIWSFSDIFYFVQKWWPQIAKTFSPSDDVSNRDFPFNLSFCECECLAKEFTCVGISVTSKKSPKVCKICPKMMSLEKW